MVRSKSSIALFLLVALLLGGWTSWRPAAAQDVASGGPASSAPAGPPANDDQVAARTVAIGEVVEQSTAGATMAPGEVVPCTAGGASVWFKLTVPTYEPFVIDTRGSDFDTTLAVWEDGPWGSYQGGCDDDSYGFRSMVRRYGSPTTTYWIQAAGADGATGHLRLSVAKATGRIVGRILDATTGGRPSRRTCVRVLDQNDVDNYARISYEDGTFEIPTLQDGTFRVQASECSFGGPTDTRYAPAWASGATSAATAPEVEVVNGRVTTHPDLLLPVGGTLSGRVVDEAGNPIAACVGARPADNSPYGYGSARSGADGSFVLGGLATGRYSVSVSECTWPPAHIGSQFEVDAVLGRDTSVATTTLVRSAEIRGAVTDAAGAPVAGVCVEARGTAPHPSSSGYTATDGTYTIPGLAPGSYGVFFRPCSTEAKAAGAAEWFDDAGTGSRSTPVTIAAGEVRAGVDAVLEAPSVVTGRVVGPGGAPVSGACVSLTSASDSTALAYGMTSVTGSYRIDAVHKGRYDVRADQCYGELGLAPGGLPRPLNVRTGTTETADDIVMARGSVVSGRAVAADTGKTIGACVAMRGAMARYGGSLAGGFRVAGLLAGDYTLTATHCSYPTSRYLPASLAVTVDGVADVTGLVVPMIRPDLDGDGVATPDNCTRRANADQADLDGDDLGDACDGDDDGDSVPDVADNCAVVGNADQADLDGDDLGDACDGDRDGDGAADASDNCPATVNPSQADLDADGIGDACDDDADSDGVADAADNCAGVANVDQADLDGDGAGDACDADADGDGVADASDNCTGVANGDQADLDGDGVGDACDGDADGDGAADGADNCAGLANGDQADLDGDGLGDACDGDRDGDAVADASDNCAATANGDQADLDADGMGDACDADADGDGVADASDNCAGVANGSQGDLDGDGRGDPCDPDADGDGVADVSDNCAAVPNGDQADLDADGAGDACDVDTDSDGVDDVSDNCAAVPNGDQADLDADGAGDACDADDDGDGVADGVDNCRSVANPSQADLDRDGVGDACDADADGDGVADVVDNCAGVANGTQSDLDRDRLGDACDADDDGDGVADAVDNCPATSNSSQADLDGDRIGDLCDPDDDGDGVADATDNCPATSNPTQLDLDGNGVGDACQVVPVPEPKLPLRTTSTLRGV